MCHPIRSFVSDEALDPGQQHRPAFVGRKERAESEIQESRGLIEKLQHDREQVNAETAELVAQKQSQDGEVSSREEGLREQRRRLTELQEKRSAQFTDGRYTCPISCADV